MSSQDVRAEIKELINLENNANTGLTNNKVINFAYTQEAYDEGDTYNPASVASYNPNNSNNIPTMDTSVLHIEAEVLNKGLRDNSTSISKNTLNHFFGRASFNLNKAHDWLLRLLQAIDSFASDSICLWNNYTTYSLGQIICVTDSSNHMVFYKSLIDNNKNNEPSENPNMWQVLTTVQN